MEVLAVGASIAGLLSLTGQCISAAKELGGFYHDAQTGFEIIKHLLSDTNSLLRLLHDTEALLTEIRNKAPSSCDHIQLTSLKLQLEDCHIDLRGWLQTANACYQPSNGLIKDGARAWFRKFWAAVNKDKVKNVRSEMQRRRLEIALALSALGRYEVFAACMMSI
jgi:hypothetical protein